MHLQMSGPGPWGSGCTEPAASQTARPQWSWEIRSFAGPSSQTQTNALPMPEPLQVLGKVSKLSRSRNAARGREVGFRSGIHSEVASQDREDFSRICLGNSRSCSRHWSVWNGCGTRQPPVWRSQPSAAKHRWSRTPRRFGG